MSIIREVDAPEPAVHAAPPRVYIPMPLKQRGSYLIGLVTRLLYGDTTATDLRSIDEITSELVAEAASQISGYSPGGEG